MGRKADVSLYLVRLYQAQRHDIMFCTCKAGLLYRRYLHTCEEQVDSGADQVPDKTKQRVIDYLEGRQEDYSIAVELEDLPPPIHWVGPDEAMQHEAAAGERVTA